MLVLLSLISFLTQRSDLIFSLGILSNRIGIGQIDFVLKEIDYFNNLRKA